MRPLEDLGITDEFGEQTSRVVPNPSQIAALETQLGTQLPEHYKSFLSRYNGGYPQLNTFIAKKGGSSQKWIIDSFFEVSDDPENLYSVLWNYHHRWPDAPDKVIPIAQDPGGDLFYLDLRMGEPAPVLIYLHDTPGNALVHLAPSFEKFIDSLEPYDDD